MKHSELNTADALHFAKARTFTGDPALVIPDFIDQLLVSVDTQEQFISTGTNAGELIKIAGGSEPPPPPPATIDTAAFLNKILVQNGEILTTNDDQIIFQE